MQLFYNCPRLFALILRSVICRRRGRRRRRSSYSSVVVVVVAARAHALRARLSTFSLGHAGL